MDQTALVEGGAEGLNKIAEAFRARGLPISGLYLMKTTSAEGFEKWTIRLISDQKSPDLARKMIYELVRLRRDKKLPYVDPSVNYDLVGPTDPEPSRVIEYARRSGGPPVVIRDAMWKGLFIEYAIVASVPQSDVAMVR